MRTAGPSVGVQAYNARQRALWPPGLDVPERLRAAVAAATGQKVVFDPDWGLPGAQVTFSHAVFGFPVFQLHVDGDWAPLVNAFTGAAACVPHHRLSVTLALQVHSFSSPPLGPCFVRGRTSASWGGGGCF